MLAGSLSPVNSKLHPVSDQFEGPGFKPLCFNPQYNFFTVNQMDLFFIWNHYDQSIGQSLQNIILDSSIIFCLSV